ncbi:MAG: SDR family NAD(P)-dependent oxidoreductase, partial [Gemmataceae bacterium]
YEVDLSSPESLRQLHQMVQGADSTPVVGAINCLGLQPGFRVAGLEDNEAPLRVAAWTFQFVKEFAVALQTNGGLFVNVTALDGHFGLGEEMMTSVTSAGTLGIVKTLRREHPRLRVKNIDVEPAMPSDMLAARLIQELANEEDLIEVGLTRQGRWRPALRKEAIPLGPPPLEIDGDSVILITGGARGITADIARKLAAEAKPRLVLVGRSPAPEAESPRTCGLDRAALRNRFLNEARSGAEPVVPAEIERAINRLLKDREIRANLDACTVAGAAVEYHALDVRDAEAFGRLIDGLYERFGRIDGVIHGAGIIDDRRIRDKTLDSFAAVFRTKVDSAWTLARKLRPEGLKFLAFFGSVSGRFGNVGQVDYSAANEVLNKLADYLHRRWPGRVMCLNWGPWQGGMVSEELRRLYAAAGVELIPVEEGVASFLAEIRGTDRRGAEVVLARGIERLLLSEPRP